MGASFLPSLSSYFNHVAAFDIAPYQVELAKKVVDYLGLKNVDVISNAGLTIEEIKQELYKPYSIIYLLEVVEHIGEKRNFYSSKLAFLKELSTLIDKTGLIVVSAPKMVGLPFMLQRIGFWALRMQREPVSLKNLVKASFFGDTSDLEKKWDDKSAHLGFNHRKLEHVLKASFRILQKRRIFYQIVWVLQQNEDRTK